MKLLILHKRTVDPMAMILTAGFLLIALLFRAGPAIADIYTWVDQNGVTHFSDTPPPAAQKTQTIKIPEYPPPPPGSDRQKPDIFAEPAPEKTIQNETPNKKKPRKQRINKVEIFTTSW